jgi:hypothetical protein
VNSDRFLTNSNHVLVNGNHFLMNFLREPAGKSPEKKSKTSRRNTASIFQFFPDVFLQNPMIFPHLSGGIRPFPEAEIIDLGMSFLLLNYTENDLDDEDFEIIIEDSDIDVNKTRTVRHYGGKFIIGLRFYHIIHTTTETSHLLIFVRCTCQE